MSRHPIMPNAFLALSLDAPLPASEEVLSALRASGVTVEVGPLERADHGRDWWPRLIPATAHDEVEYWPGVVVQAESTEDVQATLRVATQYRVPVTPQGGRSGVVGGAAPTTGAIALDLTGLNHVLELDEHSGTVRVEAGVFGPDLEAELRPRGFTAGHFPQSYDLATVGGWIACRGAGQYSNRYGTIEDMVRGLTVVLASGEMMRFGGHGPKGAVGPDLMQLFIGSEGTLGVITEATLLVRRVASAEERAAFLFDTFDEGLEACRRTLQRDAHPAVMRLYDETESKRSFDLEGCALVVLDEGEGSFVNATMDIVREECSTGESLDDSTVEHWLERRNDVSALAPLWERGLVVDTIEVSGLWSVLPALHERVKAALSSLEGMIVVSVHQSHAYLDGACLYFTFAGEPGEDVTSFYRRAWDVAMDEVINLGASISHHHGIGRNRARFVGRALGSAAAILESMKDELDPHHLLNPGVLGLGGAPW
jgi:alkyldihydroxyacetonephosphate synthase